LTIGIWSNLLVVNINVSTACISGKTTAGETADSWGNKSNHSTSSEKQQPEIIAMGIGNPRGCSFDPDKPSYLYCSIVVNRNEMKEEYEVLLIDIEGGNRIVVVRHSGHLPVRRLPSSITGGFLYRGLTNPSLEGRFSLSLSLSLSLLFTLCAIMHYHVQGILLITKEKK
jgi:hypothetical protein